jgi:hypothetical protein
VKFQIGHWDNVIGKIKGANRNKDNDVHQRSHDSVK